MCLDEFLTRHKHPAGTAARIVNASLVGREHFHQHTHDAGRRVELSAALALCAGEARKEVLVDPPERVFGAIGRASERDIADEVDDLSEPLLVETGSPEVFGQDAFQRRVVPFDRRHGIVDDLSDLRLRRSGLQMGPACLLRNPEDAGCPVLVRIFRVGAVSLLRDELIVLRLKSIRDVFQKNKAKDDVLILCRVHIVAKRVGRLPKLRLEA